MVEASCYAKFPPPRFGGRASSFSSNYGFYAEIPDLVAQGGEKRRCSHPDKRFEKEKLSHGSFRRQPLLKWLLLTNNGCKGSQMT
jgi:hypothetical protein